MGGPVHSVTEHVATLARGHSRRAHLVTWSSALTQSSMGCDDVTDREKMSVQCENNVRYQYVLC